MRSVSVEHSQIKSSRIDIDLVTSVFLSQLNLFIILFIYYRIIFTLQSVPWGFYKLIKEVSRLYDHPPIYIIENGWPTSPGLMDESRITYFKSHMNAMLNAMNEGSDVKAYSVWSLIDTFEWFTGYT